MSKGETRLGTPLSPKSLDRKLLRLHDAAIFGVGAACRAALAVNIAVQGLVQALSVYVLVGRGRQVVYQACTASD
jgi:hypothetical protein